MTAAIFLWNNNAQSLPNVHLGRSWGLEAPHALSVRAKLTTPHYFRSWYSLKSCLCLFFFNPFSVNICLWIHCNWSRRTVIFEALNGTKLCKHNTESVNTLQWHHFWAEIKIPLDREENWNIWGHGCVERGKPQKPGATQLNIVLN